MTDNTRDLIAQARALLSEFEGKSTTWITRLATLDYAHAHKDAAIITAPRAFALLRQICDQLEALQKEATHENAWLCERGDNGPTRYVCIDPSGFFDWTDDVNKALRLCRREDADAVAAIVDDCWCVAEHRFG